MRFILNSFLYYQKAFYRARPRQINDTVTKLLCSKNEQISPVENLINNEKNLRLARGTRDYHPNQMKIREDVFRTIINCFKQHGASTIDTPILESTTLLREKYGEDNKLIYELKDYDDDDESLALRYDLTVPFARYISQNKIAAFKRYHIGKVYRRDNPKMTRGRYREFYQCDFDIAGTYDSMISDAECIKILVEILDKLSLGQYKIYINHRKLLDGIFTVCNVPENLFRSLSSSVDKLDKISWENVRNEMINEKGLTPEIADQIWNYVQLNGNIELINKLRNDTKLSSQKLAMNALNDLELLFRYLTLYDIMDKVIFDLKLARGLDYYTGVIFEAILTDYQYKPELDDDQIAVGSVAGGGRYDELVGKIDPKEKYIPCVGLSIGIERIFTIKEHQLSKTPLKIIETEVYVASAEKNLLEERMKLCNYLWKNGFKTEMAYRFNPKLLDQLQYCEKNHIELCVIIGSSELKNNKIKIRHVLTREEFEISREDLTEELHIHLNKIR